MTKEEAWVKECLGKKRYTSLHFTNNLAKLIKVERGTELYAYQCRQCNGWHLTKIKDFKERRAI